MGYGIEGVTTHDCKVYVMDKDTYDIIRSEDVVAGSYEMYVSESADTVDVISRPTDSNVNILAYKDVILLGGIDPAFQAFLMGGNNGSSGSYTIDTCRSFFTAWAVKSSMPAVREVGGAGTMLQKAHYATGSNGVAVQGDHWSYVNDTWSVETDYPGANWGLCSHTINNEFYVGGGGTGYSMQYRKYTTGDVWTSYSMPDYVGGNEYNPTREVASASDGSTAYLINGIRYNGSADNRCSKDIGNATFTTLTAGRVSYRGTCAILEGNVHDFGQAQYWGQYHDIYSISGDSWSTGTQMPAALRECSEAAVVLENKAHLAGGSTNYTTQSADHDVYTPILDTWASDVDLPEATRGHRGTLI